MDTDPIPSFSTEESKVLCFKMMGDCHRFLAEFAAGDAKGRSAEDTRKARAEATKVAETDLVATHCISLGIVLLVSVFQSEVLQDADEARKMARVAFDTTKVILHERVSEKTEEQIYEVAKESSAERVLDRNVEQVVAMPVSQIPEEVVEMIRLIQQERISEGFVKQTVDDSVHQILEPVVKVIPPSPPVAATSRPKHGFFFSKFRVLNFFVFRCFFFFFCLLT